MRYRYGLKHPELGLSVCPRQEVLHRDFGPSVKGRERYTWDWEKTKKEVQEEDARKTK